GGFGNRHIGGGECAAGAGEQEHAERETSWEAHCSMPRRPSVGPLSDLPETGVSEGPVVVTIQNFFRSWFLLLLFAAHISVGDSFESQKRKQPARRNTVVFPGAIRVYFPGEPREAEVKQGSKMRFWEEM